MWRENAHLSSEELMLFADGEVHGRREAEIREHLAACWSCRLRMREIDDAVADVSRLYRDGADEVPPVEGPRALFKARLREVASGKTAVALPEKPRNAIMRNIVSCAVAFAVLAIFWLAMRQDESSAIPRTELTPGAVRNVAVSDVCASRLGGNADVIPALQRQVFEEYGMPNARAAAYEVDYLITPALGGSDDIRNLWPQPYSGSSWNAYVKDALENRLRRMVCAGELDLSTAQQEIASNWIAAYKKYFHTNRPLVAHLRPRAEDEE